MSARAWGVPVHLMPVPVMLVSEACILILYDGLDEAEQVTMHHTFDLVLGRGIFSLMLRT